MIFPLVAHMLAVIQAALERPFIPPSWGGIVGFLTGITALVTVAYRTGRHESRVEKVTGDLKNQLNGYGERLTETERSHSTIEGVVSTLEGMMQKQLGLHEGLAGRVSDYQRETADCSTENRRLRAEITQRLETISIQVARIEVELKNVTRQ